MAGRHSNIQYDDRTPGNIRTSHESPSQSRSPSPASGSRSTRRTTHRPVYQQPQRETGKRRRFFNFLTGGIFSSSGQQRRRSREMTVEEHSRGRRAEPQPRPVRRETTYYRASWIDDEGRRVRHPHRQQSPLPTPSRRPIASPSGRQMSSRPPRTTRSPVDDWEREDQVVFRRPRPSARPNLYRSPTYESVPDEYYGDAEEEAATETPVYTRQSPERYECSGPREAPHRIHSTGRPAEEESLPRRAPERRGRVPPPAPEPLNRHGYATDYVQHEGHMDDIGDPAINQTYGARQIHVNFSQHARHSSEPAGQRYPPNSPTSYDGYTSRSRPRDDHFDDSDFGEPREGRTRPHSDYYASSSRRYPVPDDITRRQQADALNRRDDGKNRRSARDSGIEIPHNYGRGSWENRPSLARRRPRSMYEGGTTHHRIRRVSGTGRRTRDDIDESEHSFEECTDFESSADSISLNERPRSSRR